MKKNAAVLYVSRLHGEDYSKALQAWGTDKSESLKINPEIVYRIYKEKWDTYSDEMKQQITNIANFMVRESYEKVHIRKTTYYYQVTHSRFGIDGVERDAAELSKLCDTPVLFAADLDHDVFCFGVEANGERKTYQSVGAIEDYYDECPVLGDGLVFQSNWPCVNIDALAKLTSITDDVFLAEDLFKDAFQLL